MHFKRIGGILRKEVSGIYLSEKSIKEFAWQQMDAMWHNQTAFKTYGMVSFTYKGYIVVNPWMDERTIHTVNPYIYYSKRKVRKFIKNAIYEINQRGMSI